MGMTLNGTDASHNPFCNEPPSQNLARHRCCPGQVQTNDDGVVSMIAKGTAENPAKYSQIQSNRARAIEASAILITYDVKKGMIYLVGDAYLMQGFDSFSGETLDYDIDNDKVLVKGSEDGTKRVKFIIKM